MQIIVFFLFLIFSRNIYLSILSQVSNALPVDSTLCDKVRNEVSVGSLALFFELSARARLVKMRMLLIFVLQ